MHVDECLLLCLVGIMPRWPLKFAIYILFIQLSLQRDENLKQKRVEHEASEIPPHKLTVIADQTDMSHLRDAVKNMLIPRVVGTPGHEKVRNYITNSLTDLGWTVTLDKFEDTAPILGRLTFQNIIAKLNPNAERYLTLACHYDSKFFADFEFLGATDSAVPCAMLLNMAYVMKKNLKRAKDNNDLSLMFVFFDGEEAFEEWGPKDSIYGARHLAQRWQDEDFLKRIDILVLLDLLGGIDPKFYSFYKKTESWYALLMSAEERLAEGDHLAKYTTNSVSLRKSTNSYFQGMSANTYIEDDHIPFLKRNVPILHIIPMPFPDCWHKASDNHDVIDYNTVENLNKIFRLFILEYLNVDV